LPFAPRHCLSPGPGAPKAGPAAVASPMSAARNVMATFRRMPQSSSRGNRLPAVSH
jgi:hypothetical protein